MTTDEPTSRTQALPALDQRQLDALDELDELDELDATIIDLVSSAERRATTPPFRMSRIAGCGNLRSFHRSTRCGDEPSSHKPVRNGARRSHHHPGTSHQRTRVVAAARIQR